MIVLPKELGHATINIESRYAWLPAHRISCTIVVTASACVLALDSLLRCITTATIPSVLA